MFSQLLVPLDGSALAERALPVVKHIARATGARVDVFLVHQRAAVRTVEEELTTWRAEDIYVDRVGHAIASDAGVHVTNDTASGDPASAIVDRAERLHADLVVMSSHGRTGFNRVWLGSVADAVMRRARIPVLLVRADPAVSHPDVVRRILVPLDGSLLAEEVLDPAAEMATVFRAALILLRVVAPVPATGGAANADGRDAAATGLLVQEAERYLADEAAVYRARGIRVESQVAVSDHPSEVIHEWSRGCELLAMATHGRGNSRLVLGSVADRLVRATEIATLVFRPARARGEPPLLTAPDIEQQLPALSGR